MVFFSHGSLKQQKINEERSNVGRRGAGPSMRDPEWMIKGLKEQGLGSERKRVLLSNF